MKLKCTGRDVGTLKPLTTSQKLDADDALIYDKDSKGNMTISGIGRANAILAAAVLGMDSVDDLGKQKYTGEEITEVAGIAGQEDGKGSDPTS